jgi:Domain of unknown function (DUF222)
MFEQSGKVDAAERFPDLAGAIAAIPVRPDRGLAGDGDPAGEARALLALRRQLDARLLGRLAAVDEQGLAAADGFGSTQSWLRAFGNLDRSQAHSLVKAARLTETLPALAGVLAQGTIGVEHLTALAGGTKRVPDEVLTEADQILAGLAPHARPSDLLRVGRKIQACYDETSVTEDADHVHDSRHLTLVRTFGDAYHLDGLLTPEAGAALAAVLDSLMRPAGVEDSRTTGQRRADALLELTDLALHSGELPESGGDRPRLTFLVRVGNSVAHDSADGKDPDNSEGADGSDGSDGPDSPGDTFAGIPTVPDQPFVPDVRAMLADLAGQVTGTGNGGRLSPTLLGSQDHGESEHEHHEHDDHEHEHRDRQRGGQQQLDGFTDESLPGMLAVTVFGTGEATLIGTGALLPIQTLARLGCDADANFATVNQWGEVLNFGSDRRDASKSQRRALALRDRHCVFPHCDVPPARCHAHHLCWWCKGGHTCLHNLALVCSFHHHLIHEGLWTLERIPPGPQRSGLPPEPPGWLASSPDGRQLREHRQPAA